MRNRTVLRTSLRTSWASAAAVAAGICLTASLANAASYSVTGTFNDQRGQLELPLAPGIGAPPPGVPVSGTAMQTGAAVPGGGPATITLPAGVIYDPANFEGFLVPVPAVIQLNTSFLHSGPLGGDTLMASGGPGSFGYCPGAAANPTCTTAAAGGSQGSLAGIIKYTAGPNKFGGTMSVLLKGTGLLVRKGEALPPTVMTTMGGTIPALPFSALNQVLGGSETIAQGQGTTIMITNTQPGGVETHPLGYMTTVKGLITPGPAIGGAGDQSNQNTGFPWTTGQIYGYDPFGAQSETPATPFKFTITGYDKRGPAGNGKIMLVASSLSRSFQTDGSTSPEGSVVNQARLTMTFLRTPALPLSSPAALLSLGSLVMLSAGYAVSRKRL